MSQAHRRWPVWPWLALMLATSLLASCDRNPAVRLQVFADPIEVRAYQALILAYNERHPEAKVELTAIGKQKDHMAKLATSFAGGNPPDLFLLNFRRFGQFVAKGALEPLGPRLQAREDVDLDDFYTPPMEAFTVDGVLQCMPQNISSLVVYYNRALFERFDVPLPPADWNWQQFVETASALTQSTKGDGTPEIYGLGFEPSLIRVMPFVWQAGGELVDDVDHPTEFRLHELRALVGLSFVKQLIVRDKVVPGLAEQRAEGPEARFARGGLGMMLQSRRLTATLRSIYGLDWDVAPLPAGSRQASVLHSDAYCMSASSERKPQAEDFVAFAVSAEGQAILSQSGRIVPSRRSVAESPAFLDPEQKPASAQVFLDAIEVLHRTPNIASWNEVETRVDPLIEEWFFEPAPARLENPAVDAGRLVTQIREAASPLLLPKSDDSHSR